MFASRCLNNALSNVHERALLLIFKDHEKPWVFCEKNKNYSSKNLEFLTIEIYKFQHRLPLLIANDIFHPITKYLYSPEVSGTFHHN